MTAVSQPRKRPVVSATFDPELAKAIRADAERVGRSFSELLEDYARRGRERCSGGAPNAP